MQEKVLTWKLENESLRIYFVQSLTFLLFKNVTDISIIEPVFSQPPVAPVKGHRLCVCELDWCVMMSVFNERSYLTGAYAARKAHPHRRRHT